MGGGRGGGVEVAASTLWDFQCRLYQAGYACRPKYSPREGDGIVQEWEGVWSSLWGACCGSHMGEGEPGCWCLLLGRSWIPCPGPNAPPLSSQGLLFLVPCTALWWGPPPKHVSFSSRNPCPQLLASCNPLPPHNYTQVHNHREQQGSLVGLVAVCRLPATLLPTTTSRQSPQPKHPLVPRKKPMPATACAVHLTPPAPQNPYWQVHNHRGKQGSLAWLVAVCGLPAPLWPPLLGPELQGGTHRLRAQHAGGYDKCVAGLSVVDAAQTSPFGEQTKGLEHYLYITGQSCARVESSLGPSARYSAIVLGIV